MQLKVTNIKYYGQIITNVVFAGWPEECGVSVACSSDVHIKVKPRVKTGSQDAE